MQVADGGEAYNSRSGLEAGGRWVDISGHVMLLCCSHSFAGLKAHTGTSLVEDMEILTPTIT